VATPNDGVTLVDTNVLLDLITDDPTWANWSAMQLQAAAITGPLAINDVVYAELSVRYGRIEALDAMLSSLGARLEPIPLAGLFLAAKAFMRYRTRGGTRAGVLPDFFIGAHAAVQDIVLLTRDGRRFRDYFPTLRLICPR
jgi:predicted nucleic acid-binding protein